MTLRGFAWHSVINECIDGCVSIACGVFCDVSKDDVHIWMTNVFVAIYLNEFQL